MRKIHLLFFMSLSLISCGKDDNPVPDNAMYFPSDPGTAWETTPISELGWNSGAIQPLKNYLAEKSIKSFMMVAAMGAKDQRIYVIPGKKMVVVRMGNASDPANPDFAVSGFDNELWEKINAVID